MQLVQIRISKTADCNSYLVFLSTFKTIALIVLIGCCCFYCLFLNIFVFKLQLVSADISKTLVEKYLLLSSIPSIQPPTFYKLFPLLFCSSFPVFLRYHSHI